MTERFFTDICLDLHIGVNCRHGLRQSHAGVQSPLKAMLDRVDGPDAWDGDRAAVVSQAVLASLSKGAARVESMSLPEFYRRRRTFFN
jgi:hypothetical protein